MKLAGALVTRNYTANPSAFAALKAMADITLVLDDSMSPTFPHIGDTDEYIYLRRTGAWNDGANRATLLHRAFLHGCDWVLQWDDDLLPSAELFARVRTLTNLNADLVYVGLRDLWDDHAHYRIDGLWAHKDYPVLMRNWLFDDKLSLPMPVRLHRPYAPAHRVPKVVRLQEAIS